MGLAPNDDPATSSHAALGVALERLMITQCLPLRFVRRVRHTTELPPRLQCLLETLGPEATWRAFTDGAQWWFGLASQRAFMLANRGLEFDAYFFCHDALLWAAGRWIFEGGWRIDLREIYDRLGPRSDRRCSCGRHVPQ